MILTISQKLQESFKLKVIRFTNDEIMNNFESVCEKILEINKNE